MPRYTMSHMPNITECCANLMVLTNLSFGNIVFYGNLEPDNRKFPSVKWPNIPHIVHFNKCDYPNRHFFIPQLVC
jgi:hypothetical protein